MLTSNKCGYKVVDLFAGCGGLSLGFENVGFSLVGAFENWHTAAECHRLNFNCPVFEKDLAQVDAIVPLIRDLSPDVIIGGPPCQDFSDAGKRVEAKRANLTCSFAQIVAKIRPKYFVMENVGRAQYSKAYSETRIILKDAGYGLTELVLDASRCGVPQKRKRFICFGKLDEKDNFALDDFNNRLSKKDMTIRDYFGDTLELEYYYRHPRNYTRRAIYSIDEPSATIRGVNRPVPKGYPGHPKDACPISPSIRSLTTEERALVQTFPKDFKWIGNKTEKEQMIGNAVPVKLAELVAKVVLDTISLESE